MKNRYKASTSLSEVIHNYGNLSDLFEAYEALQSLLAVADEHEIHAKQIAILMHYLNKQFSKCLADLNEVDAAVRHKRQHDPFEM